MKSLVTAADRYSAAFMSWRWALPTLLASALAGGLLRAWAPHFILKYFYPAAWSYFLPGLAVNYSEEGFTRRALVGTLTHALGVEPSTLAVKLIYCVGVLAAATAIVLIAWRATRSLIPRERLLVFILLILSPATLLHWVEDPGRLDVWVVLLAITAMLTAWRGAYLLALAPALAAGLIHESYFLIFGPLFLAIAYERHRRAPASREELQRGALALSVLAVVFAYLALFGTADQASIERTAARIGNSVELSGMNPFYSYLGINSHPIDWTTCFFREDPTLIFSTFIAFGFLIAQAIALLGWAGRVRVGFALAPLLGVAALAFIALDSGRYAAMAGLATWMYCFLVLESEKPAQMFRRWPLVGLLAFTALGPLGIVHGFPMVLWLLSFVGGRPFPELAAICDSVL